MGFKDLQVVKKENTIPDRYSHMAELHKIATTFSRAGIVPDAYKGKPEDCFVALQMAHEIGMQPGAALRNIYVVNGRPTLSAQGMLGLVKSQPDYAGSRWIENSPKHCKVEISRTLRNGTVETEVGEFTWEEAQQAGLTGKGPWKAYPRNMLEARAISFCVRKLYPDLFSGLYSKEEVQDFDGDFSEPVDRTPNPEPEKKAEKKQEKKEPQKNRVAKPEEIDTADDAEISVADSVEESTDMQPYEVIEIVLNEYNTVKEVSNILEWLLVQDELVQEEAAGILGRHVAHPDKEDKESRRNNMRIVLELYLMHPKIQSFVLDGGVPLPEYLESLIGDDSTVPGDLWEAIKNSYELCAPATDRG